MQNVVEGAKLEARLANEGQLATEMVSESAPEGGEKVYAVSYPPAMCAADILRDRAFAEALGYGWLHDEDTEFVRTFRQQVQRQAELYQSWLDKE